MRDVARIAGVSIATISRVLHDSPLVDPTTAQRVQSIIRDLNYIPNTTGTALKSGKSGIFGLIVPELSNPFFADFVKHFEREVVEHGQDMMLAFTDHSPVQIQQCVRRMLMRGVEGIALLDSEIGTRSYETMLRNRIPLVTLNRLQSEPGVSDIAVDATPGMTAAIAHLIGLGHRHIGFLGGKGEERISVARTNSFREAMAANKLPILEQAIVNAEFQLEGGYYAMERVLVQAPSCTAVLCANDMSALGAIRALRSHRRSVPEDFSVIGLDDIALCTLVEPAMTTLRLSRQDMARKYLRELMQLRESPHKPGRKIMVGLELIVRDSTSKAPSQRRKSFRG
ncbi:MAG TPA: LacI family DNA-binding transcriptional regulator [Terracidiphilus sp.]|nr:LacI family DNA-binding transcriptional regulator [Terracidiphilus sp.]